METGNKADRERPLSDLAEERIRPLLDAAEEAAERIVDEAREEAQRLIAAAEAESERMIAGARTESEGIVARARKEAGSRIEQARGAVEGLAGQADELRARIGALGEDLVGSLRMGATDGDSGPAAEVPAPSRPGDSAAPSTGGPSTEELIAQLRGGPAAEPVNGARPAPSEAEARLLAMNLALGGASRAEIAAEIEAQLGEVPGLGDLLDDVIARAQGS